MTLGCSGQQSRVRRAHGGRGTAGTAEMSDLPALPVEGEGAERALSSPGRGDAVCSAGAAPARSNPGGCRVSAHSWRRKGAAGWRPGIFRSFSSLSAEMKERPGFICHSSAAAQSRRRRVMSLRHRPMPSGQNATRSLETGEYRAASESRTERRARRRDQQILTALWLGRSAGAGGAWGDGSAGSRGAGVLLTPQASLRRGQVPHMGQGAAGRSQWDWQNTALMHLEAMGHGCSECSVAASAPAVLMDAAPCGASQLSDEAVWAHSIPSPQLPPRQCPQDPHRGEVIQGTPALVVLSQGTMPRPAQMRARAKGHPGGLSLAAGVSLSLGQELKGRYPPLAPPWLRVAHVLHMVPAEPLPQSTTAAGDQRAQPQTSSFGAQVPISVPVMKRLKEKQTKHRNGGRSEAIQHRGITGAFPGGRSSATGSAGIPSAGCALHRHRAGGSWSRGAAQGRAGLHGHHTPFLPRDTQEEHSSLIYRV